MISLPYELAHAQLVCKEGHMLRLNGIQAEVLLKLTKEYKPEILHGMKHWKSTQREVR